MLAALGPALYYLLVAAIQLGIFWVLEKVAIPLINAFIENTMVLLGVDRETAQDIASNEVLELAESLGLFALSLKSKLPLKVADAIGLSSRGFAKKKLTAEVTAKVSKVSKAATPSKIATSVEVGEIASAVSKARGIALPTVKSLLGIIATLIGVPTAFFFALAQYIDFANWQGPYQKTFQNLLSKVGINPDTPLPKASVVSADIWKRIHATVEELDPIGISFPFSNIDKPYSRQALADLVDEIAANLVKAGGTASFKNVMALVLPLVQLSGKGTSSAGAFGGGPGTSAGGGIAGFKVFMGTVKDGVLGAKLDFTPRQDDLIENMSELQDAINNNLAPYLLTLPGRIVYEIKVVGSVVGSDGIKRYGAAQTIQTGVDGLGRPKTKTVVNKWAVLYLYILTDRGVRSKITSIVLGPTDAIKFRPDNSALAAVSQVIPTSAVTLDTRDIISVSPNETKPVTVEGFAQAIGVPAERIDQKTGEIINPTEAETAAYNYQFGNTPSPVVKENIAADRARTLFEWYAAQGQKLPSLSNRGELYQKLGLGQASLYVGSAEQNTRLLNKLKEKPPPPPPVAIAQPSPAPVQNIPQPAPSGFFRPSKGTPVFDRSSGASLGVADGNTDYNSAIIRT